MEYLYDDSGFHVGSKTFVGECINCDLFDIGKQKFDGKRYIYPGGKYQIVKSNTKVFRIPIPGMLPDNKKIYRMDYSDGWEEENTPRIREDNLLRANTRVSQIVLLNSWDYFLTITFNDELVDASDVNAVIMKLQRWLKNLTYRKGIGYLLIPEYHKKDKRVHCHALVKGKLDLEFNDIYKVKGRKQPMKLSTIKRCKVPDSDILYPVYNCKNWKYGFSTAIDVYGSPGRLSNYVLKYMTKESNKIFQKRYWVSKNLQLYPTTELYTLDWYEFRDTVARQYYHRGSDAAFKYINRLGEALEDDADEQQEVLDEKALTGVRKAW